MLIAAAMSTFLTLRRRQQTSRPWQQPPSVDVDHQIRKCLSLDLSILKCRPTFGPAYATGVQQFSSEMKEKAWRHVIEKTEGSEEDIENQYTSAVTSIKSKAKASYADSILTNLSDEDFTRIMVRDGCFFLQLVLSWFGADLEYHPEHPVFGVNEKGLRMLMGSMFIVGNQIPLVVLEELMNQTFFRLAIARTNQWNKPSGLLETVLYEFLLVPASSNNHPRQTLSSTLQQPIPKPCDLLHGLHSMVLDLCGIDPNEIYETEEIYIPINFPVDNSKDAEKFPCAKELSKSGIRFEGVDGSASRGICFKPEAFGGVLYLPCLEVDDSTELMFQCLKAYETTHQDLIKKYEVSSYLRFLRELVPTVEDAKILASDGVLKGQIEKFPVIFLGELLACNDIGLSRKLQDVRLQVNDYSCSWPQKLKKSFKLCLKGAVVMQTVFTVLQYYKSRDSSS